MKQLTLFTTLLLLLMSVAVHGQKKFIKSLQKTAEEAAKRTVDRKVDEKTEKTTEAAFDSLFNNPNVFRSRKNEKRMKEADAQKDAQKQASEDAPQAAQERGQVPGSVARTFIPSGVIMYSDNFERDAVGDFPARWETNSGGEIVTVDDFKALRTSGTGFYIPMLPGELPENYAVEFDLFTYNLAYKGTSALRFEIHLTGDNSIGKSRKGASIEMPLWYKGASDYFQVETYGISQKISNKIPYDYTELLNDLIHFTLVKNGKRVRLFIDDTKVVDIPSLAQEDLGKYIKFYVREVDLQKDLVVALANLQITEEGEDLRSMLLRSEGFSTTAILFNTASDELRTESFVFLDKLGKVLQEDGALKVQITGHTDSDGDAQSNLQLSERRAQAVAKYLQENFAIAEGRLRTEGKGESQPLNNNATAAEKAANRRVEFKTF